jgi:16S rRNA processing protein RimM
MEEFLQVGAIANTHGIAGEVKVFPMTDDIKRFKKLKEVYLDKRKKTITRSVMQIRKEPAGFEI